MVLAVGIGVAALVGAGALMVKRSQTAGQASAGPASREVQAAYDDAKVSASALRHIDDLQIREATCRPIAGRRYSCQINFVQTLAPQGRLFFTVVTIEQTRDRWALIAGLCKSPAV